MSSQMILRGGSCATPASHIRPTYRNFFHPATLAVHGHTPGFLDEFVQLNMITYPQAFERKHIVPLDTRDALIHGINVWLGQAQIRS